MQYIIKFTYIEKDDHMIFKNNKTKLHLECNLIRIYNSSGTCIQTYNYLLLNKIPIYSYLGDVLSKQRAFGIFGYYQQYVLNSNENMKKFREVKHAVCDFQNRLPLQIYNPRNLDVALTRKINIGCVYDHNVKLASHNQYLTAKTVTHDSLQ